MGEIKAIETVYNGYRFRSRLEARWAVFFDAMHIEYVYEPEGFIGFDNIPYLPDFYLPEEKVYVEVKGYDERLEKDWDKIAAAIDWKSTPVSNGLLVLGDIPNPDKVGVCSLPIFSYLYWNEGVASEVAAFTIGIFRGSRRSRILFGLEEIRNSVFIPVVDAYDGSEYGQPMPHNLTTKERWVNKDSLMPRDFYMLKEAYTKARHARFEFGERP